MHIDLPFASAMRIDAHRHLWQYASEELFERWQLFEQRIVSLTKPERDQVQVPQGEGA